MKGPLRTLVKDYSWVHLSLGICGNIAFFIGSIFFLPSFSEVVKTAGIWLFIIGSFLMMIGAIGNLFANLAEKFEEI